LGLSQNEINNLNTIEKVKVIEFTDDEKNSHPKFNDPKTYVFKPTCIKKSSEVSENFLWLDAGVCALKSIEPIFNFIDEDDIFLVVDVHLIKTFTHTKCKKIMDASDKELNSRCLSAGMVGFKSKGKYYNIIRELYLYSLIPGCCDGNEENHRHDLSILSILGSRHNCPTQDIDIYGYWTDTNRTLFTAIEKGAVIFVHRRGYENKVHIKYKNNETVFNQFGFERNNNISDKSLKINLIDDNLSGQDGLSRYISPNSGWMRNSKEFSDIVIYTDSLCHTKEIDDNKINFAWLIEPPIINGENYDKILKNYHKFDKVFSYNLSLKDKINNFVFLPHGGTWLREQDIRLHDKSKKISFIYSDKQWNNGHRVRHNFANFLKQKNIEIDHFGSGSEKKIDFKSEALNDYMFSIVIENSVQDTYFTEKILDCFLSGVIPIYWGTKKISEIFDEKGIIFLPDSNEYGFNFDDAIELISTIGEEFYNSRLMSISNNFNIAQKYIHPEAHINEHIKNN